MRETSLLRTGPASASYGTLLRMRVTSSAVWTIPFCLLVFTIVAVPPHLLDAQGIPRYRALREELQRVRAKNERLRREVRELRAEVTALRTDPHAVEHIARDELGMVRKGEIVLQFSH